MYNEFLFFYEKEPCKQFVWRYRGQISPPDFVIAYPKNLRQRV